MLGVELLELETNLLIKDLKPLKKDNDIMCECEEHKAKWILTDKEIEYYDNVCDSCESKMHEQLINESTKDNK